jgi:hypothetical protein
MNLYKVTIGNLLTVLVYAKTGPQAKARIMAEMIAAERASDLEIANAHKRNWPIIGLPEDET